jgi:hypothetical protein
MRSESSELLSHLTDLIPFSFASVGATQWEPPIAEVQPPEYNHRPPGEESYGYDPRTSTVREPTAVEEVFVDPALNDPWASVDIDDENDFSGGSELNRDVRDRDNRGDDYSDDDNWHDDRFQQSTKTSIGRRGLSGVQKKLFSFKTSYRSLKALLKEKASKKKSELLASMKKRKESYNNIDGTYQISDKPYNRDYSEEEGETGRQDPVARSPAERDWVQPQQQQPQQQQPQQQQPQQKQQRHGEQYSTSDYPAQHIDGQHKQKSDSQPHHTHSADYPQDQSNKHADSKVLDSKHARKTPDIRPSNKFIDSGVSPSNREDKKIRSEVGKEVVKEESPYDLEEKRLEDLRRSEYGKGTATNKPQVKISVRSMGKLDESLWADYDDSDEKIDQKKMKSKGIAVGDSLSGSELGKKVSGPRTLAALRGVGRGLGGMVGSFSGVVPVTSRMAVRVLSVAFSAAPLRVIALATVFLLLDVLLPIGLIYLAATVRHSVQSLAPPSLLFSGIREHSPLIIPPVPPSPPPSSTESSIGSLRGEGQMSGRVEWDEAVNLIGRKTELVDASIHETKSKIVAGGGGGGSSGVLGGEADSSTGYSSSSSSSGSVPQDMPSRHSETLTDGPRPHTSNLFSENFQGFPSLLMGLENYFKSLLKEAKATFNAVTQHSSACTLLGLIFISVILCGVFLPALKQNIGERIVSYIQKNEYQKRIQSQEAIIRNRKEAENSAILEDLSYLSDDDDDDENSNRFFTVLKKMKRRAFPRSTGSSPGYRTAVSGAKREAENSFPDELIRVQMGGDRGSAELPPISGTALQGPIELLLCVWRGYLSSFYLFVSLLFISLLQLDDQLARAVSLPYALALVFSLSESYFGLPSRRDISKYRTRGVRSPSGSGDMSGIKRKEE